MKNTDIGVLYSHNNFRALKNFKRGAMLHC